MTTRLAQRPAAPPWSAPELRQQCLDYNWRGIRCLAIDGRKRPVGRWAWVQHRRPGDADVDRWFRRAPSGIAAVCGWASGGLAVRDFDDVAAYSGWAARFPDTAARCWTVFTPRPGVHLYFRLPVGHPEVHRKDRTGELIADRRHYVVLPESAHPSGRPYVPATDTPLDLRILPALDPAAHGLMPAAEKAERSERTKSCSAAPSHLPLAIPDRLVPTGPGERNARLLALCRWLKPRFPDQPAVAVLPEVTAWFRLAEPAIRTKDFNASWADFEAAWASCDPAAAGGPATPFAGEMPPGLDGDTPRRLVALCRGLAASKRGEPFHLSGPEAGRRCGVSHQVAHKWINRFLAAGLLRLVEPGVRGPRSGKAAVYRWEGG